MPSMSFVSAKQNSFITETAITVLCPEQFGFRKKRGTVDALFSILSEIYSGVDCRQATGGIFCDLSRAFEMVPHCILLEKLFHLVYEECRFHY